MPLFVSSISGTVIGNDQILCGNLASTYYVVTPMKDSVHPLRDGEPYVIGSASATLLTCGNAATQGTFDLVTALPMISKEIGKPAQKIILGFARSGRARDARLSS